MGKKGGLQKLSAPATADPYTTHDNLSAAMNYLEACNNLCSTATDPLGTCNDLSATADPYETRDNLRSTTADPAQA